MKQHEVWSFVHTLDKSNFAKGLENNNGQVRKLTVQRIGVMRDTAEIPRLIEALRQECDEDVEDEIIKALTRMGEPAVLLLMQGLTDENEDIRRVSADGLGCIGCVAAIKNLCIATGDPNPRVRKAAVQALGFIGILNDEVEATILTCLDDENKVVVQYAAYASGDLGCTAAVSRLISLLDDVKPNVQRAIIQILGDIGDDRATDKLGQLLIRKDCPDDTDFTVDTSETGEDIIDALGKIADPRAVQPLMQALIYYITCDDDTQESDTEDGYKTIRADEQEPSRSSEIPESIFNAFNRIGKPAIPLLIETLREWADDEECSDDPCECTCCSISVASEISFILNGFGSSGIDAVLNLLNDEKVSVRKLAVKFFSEEHLNEQRVLDALITCMITDSDKKVKTLAAYRLADGGQKSFEAIVSALKQLHRPFTEAEKEAIRFIGTEALSSLTRALDEHDVEKRCIVLDAFQELIKSSPKSRRMEALEAFWLSK